MNDKRLAVDAYDGSYVQIVLSVDEIDWTDHWLSRDRRCDHIRVFVAQEDELEPKIHLRAVESKSRGAVTPLETALTSEPFRSGSEQVVATLDSLWELLDPDQSYGLVEDLRYASFIEHLFSVALADFQSGPVQAETSRAIDNLTRLSLRELPAELINVDGMVVCTQYKAAVEKEILTTSQAGIRDWRVHLVRCGSDELNRLLTGDSAALFSDLAVAGSGGHGTAEASDTRTVEDDEGVEVGTRVSDDQERVVEGPSGADDRRSRSVRLEDTPDAEPLELAHNLFEACRQRDFPVEEPVEDAVAVGPTLLSVSMPLESGASKRPIESAEEDLAREVGVSQVTVENDPTRPYHIRFLVARRQREYPLLPDSTPQVVDGNEKYFDMNLGLRIDGRPYTSWVSGWPHMLIGGTTGSGKTTFIKSLLIQFGRFDPSAIDVVLIDGKGEVDYFGILDEEFFSPQFGDVVLGQDGVLEVFDWLIEEEVERRKASILEYAKERNGAPQSARELFAQTYAPMSGGELYSPLVVVVDEFAEIMLAGGNDARLFEARVQQVAQAGRSRLIHLILATQRPDAKVVSGSIKANLDARVALSLPTHHDSQTILGAKGAESLLGKGDLIFKSSSEPGVRLQGYSV